MRKWLVTLTVGLIGTGMACGSDDDAQDGDRACVPGQSIACVGSSACDGAQRCNDEGSGYEACVCGAIPDVQSGGEDQDDPEGDAGRDSGSPSGGRANGGSTSDPNGGTGSGKSGAGSGGGSPSSCSPEEDMSNHDYPSYRSARHLGGSCTEEDVSSYYTDCYSGGDCAVFEPGGEKADCGACMAVSQLDDDEYGPLIRLGSGTNALDETNMAGCIELVGEPDCAPNIMVAALCEYDACAENCPLAETATGYQDAIDCMRKARTGVCEAAQTDARCISQSSYVTACSGSGFDSQFLAVGRVFCVENY